MARKQIEQGWEGGSAGRTQAERSSAHGMRPRELPLRECGACSSPRQVAIVGLRRGGGSSLAHQKGNAEAQRYGCGYIEIAGW